MTRQRRAFEFHPEIARACAECSTPRPDQGRGVKIASVAGKDQAVTKKFYPRYLLRRTPTLKELTDASRADREFRSATPPDVAARQRAWLPRSDGCAGSD